MRVSSGWHGFRSRSVRDRTLLAVGATALGLLVLGAVWVVVTGLLARSELEDVRTDLSALRRAVLSGDISRAHQLESAIEDNAASAHEHTSGPAWWVAANIPGLGSPLRTTRTITAEADRLGTDVVPGVLELVGDLLDLPRSSGASFDLRPIQRAAPVLDQAARTTQQATSSVKAADGSWLPLVSSARSSLVRQLQKLTDQLQGADRAVRVALPMLGASSRQRFFVGFMNEAESRPLGGIPGAYAIVTADKGRITFEKFGSDDDFKGARAEVNLGAEYRARYAQDDPAGVLQNSDIGPDFRDAARIWAGLWKDKTGETVTGAIALDPTALSYLLAATGQATGPGGTSVRSDNVVRLTQQKQYALYPSTTPAGNAERKAYLTGLARTVARRLTSGSGDSTKLLKGASRAAQERRLLVWSADPKIESDLVDARWAGVLGPTTPGAAYSGFTVTNAAGSKLDYYLDRTMQYRRSGCEVGATAVATLDLNNDAPARGLPPYVTIRADKSAGRHKPGDNSLIVSYFATRGARVDSVTLDGKPLLVAPGTENGLVALSITVELPVGRTRELSVTTTEPQVSDPVQILRQPLVRPLTVEQTGDRCDGDD